MPKGAVSCVGGQGVRNRPGYHVYATRLVHTRTVVPTRKENARARGAHAPRTPPTAHTHTHTQLLNNRVMR